MTENTVYKAFANAALTHPDRPLLNVMPGTAAVYKIAAGEVLYGAALRDVDHYATRFADAGYTTGMRVALLLENRPDFFLIWLALNKIGVSVVPINPDLRLAELEYLIGHAEPALIIALPARHIELTKAARNASIDLAVIATTDTPPKPRQNAIVADTHSGGTHEAAILYTSGTTGAPKGCVLPNAYFLLAGRWYRDLGGIGQLSLEGERMITPLPIYHMNAMAFSFMAMIMVGGCLTALDRFHPTSWWSDVKQSRATCLHYLGVMPSILMGMPAQPSDCDHTIRFGFGAGVDPKLQAEFEARFGFPVVEAWAMTETGAGALIAAQTPDRLVGMACLGRVSDAIEFRLIDDQGHDVTTPSPGELLVRRAGNDKRYGFFSHYYKDNAATDAAWLGGWFHTGDIVRQDVDGNMFFVDRKKNVIRRSGENIAAVEVESILMRHPDIQAAAVTAVPDPLRGDEVFACLKVGNPGSNLAENIAKWCLEQMAYYKIPGYIAFVDALPLTPTQKIQRAELKRLALSLLKNSGRGDPDVHTLTHLKKRQST